MDIFFGRQKSELFLFAICCQMQTIRFVVAEEISITGSRAGSVFFDQLETETSLYFSRHFIALIPKCFIHRASG